MNRPACLALFLAAALHLSASPTGDLASPDQATRDVAAKIVRATYQPPPRAKWEPLLAKLTPGMTQQAFADQFARFHLPFGPAIWESGGGSHHLTRLDDGWQLISIFNSRSQPPTLIEVTLVANIDGFWVDPPPKFTGTWTTYFVNGRKNEEVQYRNGVYFGTSTSYNQDGTKNLVQRYDATGFTDETDYYPSGRIKCRTLRAGASDNITNYREDGTIASTDVEPNYSSPGAK